MTPTERRCALLPETSSEGESKRRGGARLPSLKASVESGTRIEGWWIPLGFIDLSSFDRRVVRSGFHQTIQSRESRLICYRHGFKIKGAWSISKLHHTETSVISNDLPNEVLYNSSLKIWSINFDSWRCLIVNSCPSRTPPDPFTQFRQVKRFKQR